MTLTDRVYQVFAAADQLNLDEWITYFTKEAQFRFGNMAPITGQDNIRQAMTQFFSTIQTMHHDFVGMIEQGNVVIAEAEVTFTRLDNKVVQIPAVTIFRMQEGLVQDFRLYMDAAPIDAGS